MHSVTVPLNGAARHSEWYSRPIQSMDFLTKEERSKQMRFIRCKDTKPELLVRRLAHRLGYRYCLHRTDPTANSAFWKATRKTRFIPDVVWHLYEYVRKHLTEPWVGSVAQRSEMGYLL